MKECNNEDFSLKHYQRTFETAIINNYKIIKCEDFFNNNYEKNSKILINRIDIDLSCKQAEKVLNIFNNLGIKATFFVRLHAPQYNPFSFENYRIINKIIENGHEVGLHTEMIDCSKIWNERDIRFSLIKDRKIIENMFNIKITGVASHRGPTGFNNLDFWKDNEPFGYGLLYEAYDPKLFNTFYVSDALFHGWKCYRNGILEEGNNLCLCKHIDNNEKIIYSLTHPIKYFERHIYENE